MEDKRFDDLSRTIASMSSRRSVLRGIVGGAVAGVVGAFSIREAEAKKRHPLPNVTGDCYNRCVNFFCFHTNQTFNGTITNTPGFGFNSRPSCEQFCAHQVCRLG
jgi:hypothetical protein